jgi:acyl-CoA hydrolase
VGCGRGNRRGPDRFDSLSVFKIPQVIESLLRPVDLAIVQITPPNEAGSCSLVIAIDVAREALEQATICIGEINTRAPRTFGDTFVQLSEFDFLVYSTDPPIFFEHWKIDDDWNQAAHHVASLIENESCIVFSIGPLFEAMTRHLMKKHHLGIHSLFFTDFLMDLMKFGAVTKSPLATLSSGRRTALSFLREDRRFPRSKKFFLSNWSNFKCAGGLS